MGILPSRDEVGDKRLDRRRSTDRPLPVVVRSLLGLVGLGLVGIGIAAIFSTDGGAGAATLVVAGSLLLLIGTLGEQLESLRFGDLEVRLLRRSDEAASRGDFEQAKVLRRAADIVGLRARETSAAYKSVRNGMPTSDERTRAMDAIVRTARADSRARDLDEEEVLRLLWAGSEGARVWALAVLQERPELATPRAVLDAIQHPDEMFDQFQAITLAGSYVDRGTSAIWSLERVGEAVHHQLHSGKLGTDKDSLLSARSVLARASRRIQEEAQKQNMHVSFPPEWSDCLKCMDGGREGN